ncbi:hypothetical protein WA026_010283 [Henosepilachna vigintioctopunctata]|uniref:G-protein coupled receptors family 1 profile domain-containing protein n=1 Tax=Henosepilachna vigintioctopunctata TaxID=420089 RepID=A0AAW1UI86_9CUCU
MMMIAGAWGISLILWPPWIYSWPYLEGRRTVPDDECYIQFIETNHYITFGTAIAAFYVPVTVMCFLYWRIWLETKKRQKDLPNLQAGKKDSSKRSNSSDEANNVCSTVDMEEWKRPRSESSAAGADSDSVYMHNSGCTETHWRRTQRPLGWLSSIYRIRSWCIAWWHSGREESDTEEESPSEQGQGCITPVSVDTPLQSSVSRCTSLNVIRDPYNSLSSTHQRDMALVSSGGAATQVNTTPTRLVARDCRSLPPANRLVASSHSTSTDTVYTILIKLPPTDRTEGETEGPSIKMIPEDRPTIGTRHDGYSLNAAHSNHVTRRPSAMPDIRIPLNAKIIPKQLAGGKNLLCNATKTPAKKKKKTQEKKADKKAAKTLSAILFSFIITWLPYSILVLLKPVTSAGYPPQLWDFFYYLCYINSTINPVCYALCNASFRRTYLRILQCKWHNRNRAAMNRWNYN